MYVLIPWFTVHFAFSVYCLCCRNLVHSLETNSDSDEASSPNSPIIDSDEESIPIKKRPKLVKLTICNVY